MTLFRLSPHFSCLSFSIQSSSFNSEIWGLWNALIFGFKCAKKQHRNNRTRSARNKDVSSFWSCLCDSGIHADKLENSWNQLLTTAATDHSVSNLHACLSHSSSFSLHQSFVVGSITSQATFPISHSASSLLHLILSGPDYGLILCFIMIDKRL